MRWDRVTVGSTFIAMPRWMMEGSVLSRRPYNISWLSMTPLIQIGEKQTLLHFREFEKGFSAKSVLFCVYLYPVCQAAQSAARLLVPKRVIRRCHAATETWAE